MLPAAVLAVAALLFPASTRAGEMDVAREALRDGLWDVARSHAAKVEGDEAKLLVLETYAREGKWGDLLNALGAADGAEGDGFAYYRALALLESGKTQDAAAALSSHEFKDPAYAKGVARLKARAALKSGDAAAALKIVKESGFDEADVESRMAAAGIMSAAGDRVAAERIWREVAADTNADERAVVSAACSIGDAAVLRAAYARVKGAEPRREAGLTLGRILLGSAETLAEGTNLVCALALDAPDAEGAREAYVAYADAMLGAERWQEASDAYRVALETWPAVAQDAQAQEGRGWALRRLGRFEEAAEAFARAQECAETDDARANAALERGEALSEAGRGEEAMAKFRQVLEKYPKTAAGERLKVVVRLREMDTRARELFADCRFEEARKAFAELAEADPAVKPRTDFYDALCLYGQGRYDEAQERARAVAASGPDQEIRAEATLWLAKYAYNESRWDEAGRLFAAYATNAAPESAQAPSAVLWAARAAFAGNEFQRAIDLVAELARRWPDAPERARGGLVQGEALIELTRFDEAALVLDRTIAAEATPPEERVRAQVLKADALFAMGADNQERYREALDAYRAVRLGGALTPAMMISVAFKSARTLEKLRRTEEAMDQYYSDVVLAYRQGRQAGVRFDDDTRANFARAAFRLAEEYESRGMDFQAMHMLELVVASDVQSSDEAERRMERIHTKGMFR